MSFAAAFQAVGTVSNLLGARSAQRAAAERYNYEAAVAQRAREQMQRQANVQNQLGSYYSQLMQDQDEYFRDLYDADLARAQELQRYMREGDIANEARLQSEFERTLQRQQMQDAAARERRMFELERIASDDRISQAERELALDDLARMREVARAERAQELDARAAGQGMLASEYQDRLNRLTEDRMQRALERQREVDRQDQIIAELSGTRDRMRDILDRTGRITPPELLGQEEIDRRADEYYGQLEGGVQAAMDRALSTGEADMIRRGMDVGGASNEQRSEILARLMPQLQQAQIAARQSASRDVAGLNRIEQDQFALLRQALSDELAREQTVGQSGLDLMARLGAAPSAVYDANVGSAFNAALLDPRTSELNARGALDIASLLRNVSAPSAGISDILRPQNIAYNRSAQDATIEGPNLNTYDFGGFYSRGMGGLGDVMRDASVAESRGFNRAREAAINYGALRQNASEGFGRFLDKRFPNIFDEGNALGAFGGLFGGKKTSEPKVDMTPTSLLSGFTKTDEFDDDPLAGIY